MFLKTYDATKQFTWVIGIVISSSETSDTEDENSSLWLEQHWRSARNMSHLRERLEANVAFHAAASLFIKKARNEMLGRFLNQVWDEKIIQAGYIDDKSE